jgi:hypothetical protein
MTMRILQAIGALAFGVAIWSTGTPPAAGTLQVAQGKSCSSFQTMCANRCKTRAPHDPTCVEDHCTPKLMTCRQDGCWQEGRLYGGKKTCGLARA